MKGAPLGRPFWLIWTAASVSYAGDGLVAGALPLLAASMTRDPRLVAMVDVLLMAGWLLLGLVSGVVVDRVERLGLMWRVDVIRAVVFGLFGGLVVSGHVTIGVIFGVSFLLGLAAPFFDNASSSVLPELVPETELERANSVTQTSAVVLSNLIGPPVGAVVFVLSAGAPFVVDAVSFALAALLVARGAAIRKARSGTGVTAAMVAESAQPPARPGIGAALREGASYLRSQRVLGVLAVAVGVINMVVGGIMAILVLYVLEVLGLPQAAYGWLVAAFGVGGVAASVATPRLVRWLGPARVTNLSVVGFAVVVLALGLTSNLVVVVISLFGGGFAGLMWNVVTISYRQRIVPRALLGRVTSVYRMAAFIGMPIGAIGAGWLGHVIGLQRTYLVGGVVLLVVAAAVFRRIGEMTTIEAP